MGTYNILRAGITCPHCNASVNAEIDMHFGNTLMMDTFAIGDRYKWISDRAVQNGGRPPAGNLDGEGYTECPQCGWHYFVKVIVRSDRIEGVEPDREKPAYPPSEIVSTPSPSEVAPSWKPKPRIRELGEITYNEKWLLTPPIEDLLQQLVKFGVD